MKVKPIGSNQTEVHKDNGTVILFSYETPVAAYNLRPHEDGGFAGIRTDKKWSRTTSKHINQWGGGDFKPVPQEQLDSL